MSVVIWKDGQSELCECNYLQHQLSNGYTLENVEKAEKKPKLVTKVSSDDVSMSDEESEYRRLAKKLGVKVHHKHSLETIIKNVEAAQDAD